MLTQSASKLFLLLVVVPVHCQQLSLLKNILLVWPKCIKCLVKQQYFRPSKLKALNLGAQHRALLSNKQSQEKYAQNSDHGQQLKQPVINVNRHKCLTSGHSATGLLD